MTISLPYCLEKIQVKENKKMVLISLKIMTLADRQNYHITCAHRLFCLFNILTEYAA